MPDHEHETLLDLLHAVGQDSTRASPTLVEDACLAAREDLLAMSQAIYLALRCDQCSIGGEHRSMLETHARVYERAVASQEAGQGA